jgi:D-aspartate ligase
MITEANLDTSYPALVLKASRRTIHHGAMGVVRSLGRVGVPVYAVVEDGYTPVAFSRYLTQAFIWERWPIDNAAFILAMSEIAKAINHPAVLFPIDDLSAIYVAENAAALSRWYLTPELPTALPRQLANKAKFYSLCDAMGVSHGRYVVPKSVEDIERFVKDVGYPVVAKATEQWQLIDGRYNVKIIHSHKALLDFCKGVALEEPYRMILQEYVPGEDWIYHGYSNSRTDLYMGFTGKKLLDYPPGSGSTAVGIPYQNEKLNIGIQRFLRAITYSGIVDIDCRYDSRDGEYKIMDCNPRIGMNFRMFENYAGLDVVRAQHLDLTGHAVECSAMIEDRQFIVEPYRLLSLFRGGRIVLANQTHDRLSPRHTEYAWWCKDDIFAFIVMCLRLSFQTVRRALEHLWERRKGRPRS